MLPSSAPSRGEHSPDVDCAESDGVAVGPGVGLGAGADIGEFHGKVGGDRAPDAQGPSEVFFSIIFLDTVDGRDPAVSVTQARGGPEPRTDGVDDMPLKSIEGVLLDLVAIPEGIIFGEEPGGAGELEAPLVVLMHDAELRAEDVSVLGEVDEFVVEILAYGKADGEACPDDGFALGAGTIGGEVFSFQGRSTQEVYREPQDGIAQPAAEGLRRFSVQESLPAAILIDLREIEAGRFPHEFEGA